MNSTTALPDSAPGSAPPGSVAVSVPGRVDGTGARRIGHASPRDDGMAGHLQRARRAEETEHGQRGTYGNVKYFHPVE